MQDISAIRDIAHKTWPHTFGTILSEEQIDYMLDMMYSVSSLTKQMQKGHRFILVASGNRYVGYASCEFNYRAAPVTKIHKIYVLPELQGQGAGRLLMERITELAKAHNNTRLSLNVNRFNTAADFYRKTGFIKVAEENIPIGKGFFMEDFVMEKDLI